MDLYFVQEAVYFQYGVDYYSPRIKYDTYWPRYLKHFDKVFVIARVKEITKLPDNYHKVNGNRVDLIALPFYNGIFGYYKKRSKLNQILTRNIKKDCAYVLRVPGPIGNLMARRLKDKKVDYAVEVVGDPYEVAKYLKIPKLLRFGLRNFSLLQMRKVIKNSIAALYVTEYQLQKRYPIENRKISTAASNVIIQDEDIVEANDKLNKSKDILNRLNNASQTPIKIGVLGMLYAIKAPLDILEAINILIKEGYNVEIYYAGDGPLINNVRQSAKELNIADKVHCLGNLASGEEVFRFLDMLDLYVQFSKTEGMPRAMLEAMARGCPVISSDVGGISEILPKQFLVNSGDVEMLSKKIKMILLDSNRYKESVEKNIETAHSFSLNSLDKKRFDHYSEVYKKLQSIK